MPLVPRQVISEATAEQLFEPNKVFILGCFMAEQVIDTFLWQVQHPQPQLTTSGIFTMQLYRYWVRHFHSQPKDHWAVQCVVVATAIMAYLTTAFILWFTSYLFVYNFGAYATLAGIDKTSWFPLLDAITSTITQAFFAHRAFCLAGRNWFILIAISLMIALSFGSALSMKILATPLKSQFQGKAIKKPFIIWMAAGVAADVFISGTILVCLLRIKTSWAHTDQVIIRLVRLTLESQMPPTIIAILFLITTLTVPGTFVATVFQGIQSKFYSVGLMYSLNARATMLPNGVRGISTASATGNIQSARSARAAAAINIHVERETYTQRSSVPEGLNRAVVVPELVKSDYDSDDQTESVTVTCTPGGTPYASQRKGRSTPSPPA